jgi:uncharacterized repeat protein (TIGR01451 family)
VVGLLAATPIRARAEGFGGFSIDMTGTTVSVGRVNPGDQNVTPYATQLTVRSSMAYALSAMAPMNFSTAEVPVKTMPITALEWRNRRLGGTFTPFVAGVNAITAGGPAPAGDTTVLDLRVAPDYSTLPTRARMGVLDPGDPYRASLTYSVTSGTIDSSYAYPSPFSPDGDDVNDSTFFHWYQGTARVVDVHVFSADGVTLVRTLTVANASVGTGNVSVEWDGRDDNRTVVAEGDYLYRVRVNPDELVDPGLVLATGLVGVQRGVGLGTATVTGTIRANDGAAVPAADLIGIAGAMVRLYRGSGVLAATVLTNAQGVYSIRDLAAGPYYLEVTAPSYFTHTSATFEVGAGATVTMNILLTHNHSLVITKSVDVVDVEVGDVVGYTIEVKATGVDNLRDLMVFDVIQEGLRFLPDTALVNGLPLPKQAPGTSLALQGQRMEIRVGSLAHGRKVIVYYEATVVPGTKAGPLLNSATATAVVSATGTSVSAGPTHARIFVRNGEMGDRSLLFGRVFRDQNANGLFDPEDVPLRKARVLLDDGTIIVADDQGRYSARGVAGGSHALMAVAPPDADVLLSMLVPSGPALTAVVDLRLGVAARVDFAFPPRVLDEWAGESRAETLLGHAALTSRLDLGSPLLFRVSGRIAGFAEYDLGGGYRLTTFVDTAHQPREELGGARDELTLQPEVGDYSVMTPGVPDKLGMRLSAPWGSALLGRSGVNFTETNLINSIRSFLGMDVTRTAKTWKVRGFAGFAESLVVRDEFPNDGTTGPLKLSKRPVLPGSDRLIVEERHPRTGEVLSRTKLGRDTEYTIDNSTAQIVLHAPWPLATASGSVYFFVVQYEFSPADREIPPAFVAGGRGVWKPTRSTTVGSSALFESSEPEHHVALGLDARTNTDELEVAAEAAVSSRGDETPENLPGTDPTALRMRASYLPTEDTRVFGYVNRIGGSYTQRVDFQARMPADQTFGYLPPPSQSLISPPLVRGLFNGQRDFPFVLQGAPDILEWGTGASVRVTRDLDLSLGTLDIAPGVNDLSFKGESNHTDYLAANYHPEGTPTMFVATTGTWAGASRTEERSVVAASRWDTDFFSTGAEYRFLLKEAPGQPGMLGHSALLRGRYKKWRMLQPAALVEWSGTAIDAADRQADDPCDPDLMVTDELDRGDCSVNEAKIVALGVESAMPGLYTYAYANYGEVLDRVTSAESLVVKGAFAGLNFNMPSFFGSLRVDVSEDTKLGRNLGAGGRLRAVLSPSVMSFVSLNYKLHNKIDVRDQWNHTVGLAYRPLLRPRFFAFLKYTDKSQPSARDDIAPRRRLKLATADVVVPLRKAASMGTRLAWKRVRSSTGDLTLAMAGEDLTWIFHKRYEVTAGGRVASASGTGDFYAGVTFGLGMRFEGGFRLVAGVNYARTDLAFEADESIPGVFVHMSTTYGRAGAPAEMWP